MQVIQILLNGTDIITEVNILICEHKLEATVVSNILVYFILRSTGVVIQSCIDTHLDLYDNHREDLRVEGAPEQKLGLILQAVVSVNSCLVHFCLTGVVESNISTQSNLHICVSHDKICFIGCSVVSILHHLFSEY